MTATQARRDAIARLVEICEATWDPDLVVARGGGSVDVLLRKALRAIDGDPALTVELAQLWHVAKGRTEPLIDAALAGLPEPAQPSVPVTVEQLREALA